MEKVANINVLFIADDKDLQEPVEKAFKHTPIHITIAPTITQAMDIIRNSKIQFVLSDIEVANQSTSELERVLTAGRMPFMFYTKQSKHRPTTAQVIHTEGRVRTDLFSRILETYYDRTKRRLVVK